MRRSARLGSSALGVLLGCLLLAACGSMRAPDAAAHDGPPDNAPPDVTRIADAVPRDEPLHPTANAAATAPDATYRERGHAAWYGRLRHGAATASGEAFDALSMSAAHPTLPIPSYARVANVRTTRSVIVRINDRRTPKGSVIALSYAAAAKLGIATPEGGEVEVTRVMPEEYAQLQADAAAAAAEAARWRAPPKAAPVAVATPVAPPSAPAEQAAVAPPARAAPPVRVEPAAAATAPARVEPPPAPATPAAPVESPPAARTAAAPVAPVVSPAATPVVPSGERWSVQVGVFAVEDNAKTLRERVAAQLAAALADAPLSERTPRVERRGNRHFVLVGNVADRNAAAALAARVRAALGHDVVVVRR